MTQDEPGPAAACAMSAIPLPRQANRAYTGGVSAVISESPISLAPESLAAVGEGVSSNIDMTDWRDIAVVRRAIRQGWPINSAMRRAAVDVAVADISNEKLRPRDRHRAIRLLLSMIEQDLSDLHHLEGSRQQVEHIDRGAELAGAASILGELRRLASAPGGEPAPRVQVQADEQPGQPADTDTDTATATDSPSPSPQPADDAGAGI